MAISNVKKVGLGGGVSLYIADFTATAGAAAQTIAVEGCRVVMLNVNPQATAEPVDSRSLYSASTTNGITTITVYTNAGISAGTLSVLMDNGG